jgi:3-oxoacyl-[acyl-carrier-protein] synthase-1
MIDSTGEAVCVASASWLDPDMTGQVRLEALLFPAIDQVLDVVERTISSHLRMGLALGLPSGQPLLVQEIKAHYVGAFQSIASFTNGHAAGFMAVSAAFRELVQGGIDACVVAGVDSYIDPRILRRLEANDQLHGAGPMRNPWGFAPGEAAGALLITRGSIAKQMALPEHAIILGIGTAFEINQINTEKVCTGDGLTTALRTASEALPTGMKISDIYCDLNGEPYRSDEFGFASLRVGECLESASHFVAPADCWGDVAAAGGPLLLMLAVVAGTKGYAKGGLALAWGSGESGDRIAVLLGTIEGRGPCH